MLEFVVLLSVAHRRPAMQINLFISDDYRDRKVVVYGLQR